MEAESIAPFELKIILAYNESEVSSLWYVLNISNNIHCHYIW